jgi:hypothetical protein
MSDVTIVNTTNQPAHVGGHRIAANSRKSVASGQTFTVVADITMPDGNTFYTKPLVLPDASQTVTASLIEHDGVFDFEIAATPGPIPNEIVLVNKCPYPVTFTITAA